MIVIKPKAKKRVKKKVPIKISKENDEVEQHRCLYCCTRWAVGKCTSKCTHGVGIVCDKQKEGFKLPFSKDELPFGYAWVGGLGGSYCNTYALAEITCSNIKRFFPIAKIIKIKGGDGETYFKVMYLK